MADDFDTALDAILAGNPASLPTETAPAQEAVAEPAAEVPTVAKRRARKTARTVEPEDEHLVAVRGAFSDLREASIVELAAGRRRLAELAALIRG